MFEFPSYLLKPFLLKNSFVVQSDMPSDFPGFIFGLPGGVFYIELLILFLLLIYGINLLYRNRAQKSIQMMFRNLPLRIGVVDYSGRILFMHIPQYESTTLFYRNIKYVSELPDEIKSSFKKCIRETFESGHKVELKYQFEGRQRRASFVSLPKSNPFQPKTVMWLSMDIEIERQQQDTAFIFQNVLDNLPCSVFVKDVNNDFRFIMANKFYASQIGCLPEEIVGKTVHDLVPEEDADHSLILDREAMHKEYTEEVTKFTNMDGVTYHVKVFRKILTMPDNRVIMLGLNADITELTQKQQLLELTNGILQKIMDSLPAMISVKDAENDFKYIIWNKTAERISGIPAAEVLGKNDYELPWRNIAGQLREQDIKACSGESIRFSRKLGMGNNKYDVQTVLTSVGQCGHNSSLVVVMGMDVTEEKRLATERAKLLEDLKLFSERAQLFNNWLEDALLDVSDDFIFRKMLKTVEDRLGAADIHIFQIDHEHNSLIHQKDWNFKVPDYLCTDSIFDFEFNSPWYQELLDGKILEIYDLNLPGIINLCKNQWENISNDHLRSLYAAGIWQNNKLWGVLVCNFEESKRTLNHFEKSIFDACVHIVEILQDRRENKNKQTRNEYERKLIMDSIKIPIMLFDPNLKIIFCNNAALEISNKPKEEVYQHKCWESFCGEFCRPDDCPVGKCYRDGASHTRNLHMKGRDYLLYAYPIFIEGKLTNIIKTMYDVTEFNETQKQLSSALREAQNANKAKSFFLATISHELRTPLNAVIGFSELLQNRNLPIAEQKEYLRSINFAGNSLLNLINDVLDLSKTESGQIVIHNEPVDVTNIINEIYSIFQYRAQEKNLKFTLACSKDLPVIKSDSLRLRQIVLNLVGNAVKFTDKGEIAIIVTFKGHDKNKGTLIICVKDTGIGISKEGLEKIFHPFVQESSIRDSRAYSGTGLGLSISRNLAAIMGGDINVVSEEGKGSCFTLSLPGVEYFNHKIEISSEKQRVKLEPLKILLVDDVKMNLNVLVAMLSNIGMITISAGSGKEALEILESETPDLILTDLWMPEMNGEELARKIHEKPQTSQIKIVAVTADTENHENFSHEHFQDVLLKPVTLKKIQGLLTDIQSIEPKKGS